MTVFLVSGRKVKVISVLCRQSESVVYLIECQGDSKMVLKIDLRRRSRSQLNTEYKVHKITRFFKYKLFIVDQYFDQQSQVILEPYVNSIPPGMLLAALMPYFGTPIKNTDTLEIYFFQILESLKRLHKKGIIHADVKAANIAILDNKATLIDFGLSQCLEDPFPAGSTLDYSSPLVQFNGTVICPSGKRATPRDDFFSLFYTFVELSGQTLPWKQIKSLGQFEDVTSCDPLVRAVWDIALDENHRLNILYKKTPDGIFGIPYEWPKKWHRILSPEYVIGVTKVLLTRDLKYPDFMKSFVIENLGSLCPENIF